MMPRGPRTPHTRLAQDLAEAGRTAAEIVAALQDRNPHIATPLARTLAAQARRRVDDGVAQATCAIGLSRRTKRYFTERAVACECTAQRLMSRLLAVVARDDLLDAVLDAVDDPDAPGEATS